MTPASPASSADWKKILLLCLGVGVFLMIPLKIAGYGYFPPDDALRHVAHAVDGRPWNEVLVLDPALPVETDSHPGWHAFLAFAHSSLGIQPDALVTLSFITTFLLFGVMGLLGARQVLPWLFACAVVQLFEQGFFMRILLGRPFAITVAVLVFLLLRWNRSPDGKAKPWWRDWAIEAGVLTLAVWAHPSAWYVWLGVFACFVPAGRWRECLRLVAALVFALGAVTLITGSFHNTVSYPVLHLIHALGQDSGRTTNLVTEFQPSGGPPFTLFAAAVVLIARFLPTKGRGLRDELLSLDFLVFMAMWILGLQITRFWADWGLPAFIVWAVRQFRSATLVEHFRLWDIPAFGAILAVAFYFGLSVDINGRYTGGLTSVLLTRPTEELRVLLPDEGGTLYNTDMQIFYRMYYRFPHEKVRYMLGFEPGMMPPEDLAVYRAIQMSGGELISYKPWFDRMTEKDRVIMYKPTMPEWPGFKFERVFSAWLGRKVPAGAPPAANEPLPANVAPDEAASPSTTTPSPATPNVPATP